MIAKAKDYASFIKLRLSFLVVFSAAMGYLYGNHGSIDWLQFTVLLFAGFLITGASNGLNQVIEKDIDALINRTANRPIPKNRMSENEGIILSGILGSIGILLLVIYVNKISAVVGLIALLSYSFAYTPLKKHSSFSVFVGAIPGAIPPMLGYIAATGVLDYQAWLLFFLQFIWQFPHFWAVAWVLDEDYRRAGLKMLPSSEGRNKSSAFLTLVYTLMLIPMGLVPYIFGYIGIWSTIVIALAGIGFTYQSFNLYKKCTVKSASQLMFGSFIYLPVSQIAMVLGKM